MVTNEQVVAAARMHYNCSTLRGMQLEDEVKTYTYRPRPSVHPFGDVTWQGSAASAAQHWEQRLALGELLTSVVYVGHDAMSVLSPVTMALLEDSGWYGLLHCT